MCGDVLPALCVGISVFFCSLDALSFSIQTSTRSDPEYNGTFLFENNLCLNNGKNGINFDHSQSASAIYQNNTVYYNGVHEIIQDISVAEGNPGHRGQKVGGIKANNVLNATVVNNIIMTRDNEFSALQLNNVSGTRVAVDNIITNGTYAWPATESNNLINVDPLFVSAPPNVNGPIEIDGTDFSLSPGSPAIDAGNPSYSPFLDIDGNPRPSAGDVIASTSFENATGGWTEFGSTVEITDDQSLSGQKSLFTTDRTANWHSPRIVLNNLLIQGETYTFYVWVKLPEGETGTAQLTIKDTDLNEYYNLTDTVEIFSDEWTLLSANFTHNISDNFFFYVKGPVVQGGAGADYYIDDFSLVPEGSSPVNFETNNNILDIGAYEYIDPSMSIIDYENIQSSQIYFYPNPAKNTITLNNVSETNNIYIIDMLGKQYKLKKTSTRDANSISIDISELNVGLYFIRIEDSITNEFKILRLLKK